MADVTNSETGQCLLAGACTVAKADEIHAKLLDMVARYAILEVDRNDADEVDLSFVQLLLAARASARLAGRTVRLARPAAGTLLDVLHRGGFLAGQTPADCAFWLQPRGA
jgi:outer membrane murein-binding lipoprotein Lpp